MSIDLDYQQISDDGDTVAEMNINKGLSGILSKEHKKKKKVMQHLIGFVKRAVDNNAGDIRGITLKRGITCFADSPYKDELLLALDTVGLKQKIMLLKSQDYALVEIMEEALNIF